MSSSDHFIMLDTTYNYHSNSEMISSDLDDHFQFLSDPYFPFENSPPPPPQPLPISDEILQQISSSDSNPQFETDQLLLNPFNFSPPSYELNNLSIHNEIQFQSLPNSGFYPNGGFTDFSNTNNFDNTNSSGVKSENIYVGFDSSSSSSFTPNLPNNNLNFEKIMDRSFSSRSLDRKPGFSLQPRFNSLSENPNFPTQILSSPENHAFDGNMRRVSSTGDLQKFKRTLSSHGFSSSPLASENSSLMEEVNFKARPYNAEERKQRINRYKSKRGQRNFNKTIKYACRKTLADSRPRVRGRFARNDEVSETPNKVMNFNQEEDDEDEIWVGKIYEEDEVFVNQGGNVNYESFINPGQFQYFGSGSNGSCSFSWKPALSSNSQVFGSD